jgi:hypothetical protein
MEFGLFGGGGVGRLTRKEEGDDAIEVRVAIPAGWPDPFTIAI